MCFINTTINGIIERAGNADLVSVILAVKYASGMDEKYQLDERINLKTAWKTCKYASYAFRVPIPITQPGVELMLSLMPQESMLMEC